MRFFAAAFAVIAVVCVGCSSSGGSGSPSSSAPAAAKVCSDVAALQTSLSALTKLDIVSVGVSGVRSALADVQAKAGALAADKTHFQPQIDALTSAVSQLSATVQNLPSGSVATKASAIATQLATVISAGRTLQSALANACPTEAPTSP